MSASRPSAVQSHAGVGGSKKSGRTFPSGTTVGRQPLEGPPGPVTESPDPGPIAWGVGLGGGFPPTQGPGPFSRIWAIFAVLANLGSPGGFWRKWPILAPGADFPDFPDFRPGGPGGPEFSRKFSRAPGGEKIGFFSGFLTLRKGGSGGAFSYSSLTSRGVLGGGVPQGGSPRGVPDFPGGRKNAHFFGYLIILPVGTDRIFRFFGIFPENRVFSVLCCTLGKSGFLTKSAKSGFFGSGGGYPVPGPDRPSDGGGGTPPRHPVKRSAYPMRLSYDAITNHPSRETVNCVHL